MKQEELISFLFNFISENRKQNFLEVIENRTRHITLVLEDIYQTHNASAVLRSCDCFGIQDIHIIENKHKYETNPDVELGSSKWLSLHKYNEFENNSLECLNTLKAKGYKIYATSPHASDTIENIDVTQKTALIFGTELTGISDTIKNNADRLVKIPMFGFTESFNISVSAAICLHVLSAKLRKTSIDWKLSAEEKQIILLNWLKTSIKKSDLLEKDFLAKKKN